MVEKVWIRPKLECPRELEFRTGAWLLVRLQHDGVSVTKGKNLHWRTWREVELVLHKRNDGRRDFEKLELKLPELEILLDFRHDHGFNYRSWSRVGGKKCPSAEMIAAFLERHVPIERQVVVVAEEASSSPATRERQLKKARKNAKELLQIWWFNGACCLVLLGVALWQVGTESRQALFRAFHPLFLCCVDQWLDLGLGPRKQEDSGETRIRLSSCKTRKTHKAGPLKPSSGQAQAQSQSSHALNQFFKRATFNLLALRAWIGRHRRLSRW